MGESESPKGWVRDLVDFALNRDLDEEVERQRGAIELHPDWAEGHYNLGVLYYSQGMLEDSMKEFFTAIACDDSYGAAYRRLGELYVGLGDYESGVWYATMAAERGDSTLLESFKRYSTSSALLAFDTQTEIGGEGAAEGLELESIRRPASP